MNKLQTTMKTRLLLFFILGFSLLHLLLMTQIAMSPSVAEIPPHLHEFLKGSKKGKAKNSTRFSYLDDSFYNQFSNLASHDNIWDRDDLAIPGWMRSYFNFHQHKRKTWDPKNWASERWIIMQCLADQDKRKCGGTADRLKPILYMLRIAYQTRRILLIRWTRPANLEEFLVPPNAGFDWRVPTFLADVMGNETIGKKIATSQMIRKYASGDISLVRTRYQSATGGAEWYDDKLAPGEEPFDQIFSKVWKIFFRPSIPVGNIITKQLEKFALVKGRYVSVHLRCLYAIQERPEEQIQEWTKNAVNCGTEIGPGKPIFFSSDSNDATAFAKMYAAQKGGKVQTHDHNPNPPLHLDRCKDWQTRPASDFFDTFVDLYLLSLGGCITFNQGGFGHWAYLIGGKTTCFLDQKTTQMGRIKHYCHWSQQPNMKKSNLEIQAGIIEKSEPLFLEAMD